MKKIISVIIACVLVCSTLLVTVSASNIVGDVDKNDKITAIDARMVLQHVAGIKLIENIADADINYDGKISAADARMILQIVAGITKWIDGNQLKIFVDSFNNVKKSAKSATRASTQTYNYDNYFKADATFEELYKLVSDGADIKEDFLSEFDNEPSKPQTFLNEDIAKNFPPVGGACALKVTDVSDFVFSETNEYYTVSFKVKGKKNPSRYEGVGNVASIVTKEDLEKELIGEEGLAGINVDCDYKYALVKAKIDKSTGNMLEYSVDTTVIISIKMGEMGMEYGMGFVETWEKIEY